jgi:hypothetical protein
MGAETSSAEKLLLVRFGNHLVANLKLDKSQSSVLKGIDVDLTIPSLLLSVDLRSATCLCAIITAYLALTAPDPALKAAASPARSAGVDTSPLSKSIMQKVLMSDPTLRTLFWLEEEENRKKSVGGKAGGRKAPELSLPAGIDGDDLDLARVAQLMRQVCLLRYIVCLWSHFLLFSPSCTSGIDVVLNDGRSIGPY